MVGGQPLPARECLSRNLPHAIDLRALCEQFRPCNLRKSPPDLLVQQEISDLERTQPSSSTPAPSTSSVGPPRSETRFKDRTNEPIELHCVAAPLKALRGGIQKPILTDFSGNVGDSRQMLTKAHQWLQDRTRDTPTKSLLWTLLLVDPYPCLSLFLSRRAVPRLEFGV